MTVTNYPLYLMNTITSLHQCNNNIYIFTLCMHCMNFLARFWPFGHSGGAHPRRLVVWWRENMAYEGNRRRRPLWGEREKWRELTTMNVCCLFACHFLSLVLQVRTNAEQVKLVHSPSTLLRLRTSSLPAFLLTRQRLKILT